MMYVENLTPHMVTGMFKITARYDMVNEYTGKTELTEDADMTVQMFENDYKGWMITYMTIENGNLVVGLIPPIISA